MADDVASWSDALELKLRRSGGEQLQLFFGKLMSEVHGSDFAELRAHGPLGDGGMDGYRLGDDTVYQCYGALNGRTVGIAFLKNKLEKDLQKALKSSPQMRRWVFVHNLIDGLPQPLFTKLLELREFAPTPIEIDQFGLQQFRENLKKLDIAVVRRLLEIAQPASSGGSKRSLKVIPIDRVNFVSTGPNNYAANEKFSFSLKVRLARGDVPFTLLGITADYIGPDGCYCLNGDQWIRIGDSIHPTAGNYFDLNEPVSSRGALMTVEISRDVRPPLMIQTPADCDYGDVRLRIKLWVDDQEEREVRYFRFKVGGHLLPIDAPRDVPRLSDADLAQMKADGAITKDEFDRANRVDQVHRYQIAAFSEYIRTMHLKEGGFMDVPPEYRAFLNELARRQVKWAGESSLEKED